MMSDLNTNLRTAYQLKEDYLYFNRQNYFNEERFEELVKRFKSSRIESLKNISNMLMKKKNL